MNAEQLSQALVSRAMAQALLALQNRKLVLICVMPTTGLAIPKGVQEFQTDPKYREVTEVVNLLVPCQSCFEGIKIAIRCVRWQISPAGSLNPWLTPH